LGCAAISPEVAFGAATPNHELASKPGTISLTLGISVCASDRATVVTASGALARDMAGRGR
jgi:hypothetical protein